MHKDSFRSFIPIVDEAFVDDLTQQVPREQEDRSYMHLSADRSEPLPLLVFSHLRWHFITQRPQHLLTRAAQSRSTFFWEEPWMHHPDEAPSFVREGGSLEFLNAEGHPNVTVIRPHFFHGEDATAGQYRLLDQFLIHRGLTRFDRWYYTPMALSFSAHLHAEVTIFDCMDELSAFLGAPPELLERERELFRVADIVFTGGRSIYEAKRRKHANVHLFPSSIDVDHFSQALDTVDPIDQSAIPHPRAGFFGAIDERFDADLIREVAALRPGTHFVFIGPVIKIDPATLPQAQNLHFLGIKPYSELPAYLGGWDAALLPFAINDSTRFISPTKTPEYLAAGKRVVSTAIRDVVTDYGDHDVVEIASTPEEFAEALDRAVASQPDPCWNARVDRKLASSSWDRTWAAMHREMEEVRLRKQVQATASRCLSAKIAAKKISGMTASTAILTPAAIVQAASQ